MAGSEAVQKASGRRWRRTAVGEEPRVSGARLRARGPFRLGECALRVGGQQSGKKPTEG